MEAHIPPSAFVFSATVVLNGEFGLLISWTGNYLPCIRKNDVKKTFVIYSIFSEYYQIMMQDIKPDKSLAHAKLRLTIPKEPAFETAQRAQRMRFLLHILFDINNIAMSLHRLL